MKNLLILTTAIFILNFANCQPFELVAWNLESGEASISYITEKIEQLQLEDPIEIWGFQEVEDTRWTERIEQSLEESGHDYFIHKGSTGRNDRLVIAINQTSFDVLEIDELHFINPGMRVRSPLVAVLKEKSSEQTFAVVVNHLYRGNAQARQKQSKQLLDWAQRKEYPVIMTGDFNYDWDIDSEKGNKAFQIFTDGSKMRWLKPEPIVKSTCHTSYNSILDFIFEKAGTSWGQKSVIIDLGNNCPDTEITPDHKPVKAWFKIP